MTKTMKRTDPGSAAARDSPAYRGAKSIEGGGGAWEALPGPVPGAGELLDQQSLMGVAAQVGVNEAARHQAEDAQDHQEGERARVSEAQVGHSGGAAAWPGRCKTGPSSSPEQGPRHRSPRCCG
jgi:hypothetical protein